MEWLSVYDMLTFSSNFPLDQQDQCFWRDGLVILECNQNMMSLMGQASWAKMASLGGKLTALACYPTKYLNKAE
jgi:hypothetical protein